MSSSSSSPLNIRVRLVVYCDDERAPHSLPDIPLPHNLEGLKRFIEDKVGRRAKLLSYWNYAHHRYELLRDVQELLQEDGRIFTSNSPTKSRPHSWAPHTTSSNCSDPSQSGGRVDELELSMSRSGASSGGSAASHAPRFYHCQLWLETVLLQLEPLDVHADKTELDELRNHVARWLGNKYIGYEVQDAVRVRCPFLTRMFDETRSTRLEGNQDKVQLLYYSNNAWSVRDVLQYGFLLSRGVPKSMTSVVEAWSGGSDITTTDTRLSIPVPQNVPGPLPPASPMDDVLDSQAHPFIFTSSMLGPNVKHLSAHTRPHKVLLCEVAPGRRFMTDQSLTGDRGEKQAVQLRSLTKAPPGYDSVCYMRVRDDKGNVCSGNEASAKAEDLSIVQVQVGHSYQALPRYLLTVAPTGGPPPPLSSFNSTTVSATASPVRAPGSTASAAVAREDVEKEEKGTAAASMSHASHSSQVKERWTTSPLHSPRKNDTVRHHDGTTLHCSGSLSAPPGSLSNTPRSARGDHRYHHNSNNWDNNNNGNGSYIMEYTPRRATSAKTPQRQRGSIQQLAGTPYPGYSPAKSGYDFMSGGSDAVPTSRAHSQPRPYPNTSTAAPASISNNYNYPSSTVLQDNGCATVYENNASPQGSPPRSSSSAYCLSGSYPSSVRRHGRSPPHDALSSVEPHVMSAIRAAPSRVSSSLGLAPPTPPSPSRPDSAQNVRNGVLYSRLQPGVKKNGNFSRSDGVSTPHQRSLPGANSNDSKLHSYNNQQRTPDRSSLQRDEQHNSVSGTAEGMSKHPLIPPYHHDAANSYRITSSNSGGEGRGGSLPGPLPLSSIMRNSTPSFDSPSSQFPRPRQASPPAAFNQFLCTIHPRQLQSLYCTACEELTCPYCASIGAHRDHVIVEASDRITVVYAEVHKFYEELRHWLNEYRRTEEELRAEQSRYQAQQQRELRTLRQNFQQLKQVLQQTEQNMAQTVQQRTCPAPLAEASAVINKYVQALAPISMALNRYHSAQDSNPGGTQSQRQPLPPPPSASSAVSGTTRSVPEMLYFLRTAPPLMHRVQERFAQRHQAEERQLRDGVARYRAWMDAGEGVYNHVDWVGLRRLLEHLGTSRSTRIIDGSVTRERSSRHTSSSSLHFSGVDGAEAAGSRDGAAARVRSRTSPHSSPLSRMASFDGSGGNNVDVSRQPVSRSPVHKLATGDDLSSYSSQRTPPPAAITKRDRLLLRCLEDLQRGHIWAIQDASFYFAPGQLKAVCSTAFRLLGVQWELRIASLPRSHRSGRRTSGGGGNITNNNSLQSSSFIAAGINTGVMATRASTVMPATVDGSLDTAAARSPLATQSLPDVLDGGVTDDDISSDNLCPRCPPEEEWLGLFLFPQQHRLRMDFRVIAFSEVTWAEWQVTGWTTEMAGKGWGLYPFLQRKELMRTDKLARDNIVKICVVPISDLY